MREARLAEITAHTHRNHRTRTGINQQRGQLQVGDMPNLHLTENPLRPIKDKRKKNDPD